MWPFAKLFDRFEAYHAHGRPNIQYTGMVGIAAFPLFYLLRFAKEAAPYNDLWLRVIAVLLCIGLATRSFWPKVAKPYYIAYSYVALLYCLPFFFIFTSLTNGGGVVAVANTLMAVFFLILLSDWQNSVLLLLTGAAAAVGLYLVVVPNPVMPVDYVARLPILVLVVVGGSLFKFAEKQAEAERVKQTYAALAGSIAHEMRNSLGQLKNSLEGMQAALPMPTTANQAQSLSAPEVNALYRYLGQSELAVSRGLQVIAMTLDQVSAKSLNTSGFGYQSAAEVAHKAVQDFGYESDAARGKVSVEVVEDFDFWGDETAFLFVLFNLIKNALYYVAVSPDVTVRIVVDRHTVMVRDTGPGIASDLLPELFEPFRSTGKTGGTGLGLAYCKRAMLAFGGGIQCQSSLGQYTQFILRFPPVNGPDRDRHQQASLAAARATFEGKRILLVDDDAHLRSATRAKLAVLAARIDEAVDGEDALAMLAAQAYDLVVLDLNMPGQDGYAVSEKVRLGAAPLNRNVCMVAYTSESAHVANVKTSKAGMDGFVLKPSAQLPLVRALHNAYMRPSANRLVRGSRLLGARILLADDNALNRKAVVVYLKRMGVKVVEVEHGQAVLDHLQSGTRFDLVLMDINMPGMGGVEAVRAIRASPAPWRETPVIALTADTNVNLATHALELGMSDFLYKPVTAAGLYQKLGQWLGPWRKGDTTPVPFEDDQDAEPFASDAAETLLDYPRLASYRQLGMLDELLDDYLPEIDRLIQVLSACIARHDLPASLDALHSLLGLSGEAGALGLYREVQRLHAPIVEGGQWPARASQSLARIELLNSQTHDEVLAYRALAPSPMDAPI